MVHFYLEVHEDLVDLEDQEGHRDRAYHLDLGYLEGQQLQHNLGCLVYHMALEALLDQHGPTVSEDHKDQGDRMEPESRAVRGVHKGQVDQEGLLAQEDHKDLKAHLVPEAQSVHPGLVDLDL